MRALRTALLAGAVIVAPLALPGASYAAPPPSPLAVPDTTSRTFTTIQGKDDAGASIG